MTTVKRTSDPLQIDPDHIQVELDGADPVAEIAAVWESIRSFSSDARLTRLEIFPDLQVVAAALRAELSACDGHASDDWRRRLERAEKQAVRLHLAADALRARALHEGQCKPRGPRSPLLDQWLEDQVRRAPDATAKVLWRKLPTDTDGALYLEDEKVTEHPQDATPRKPVGFAGFEKRLTEARRRARFDASN